MTRLLDTFDLIELMEDDPDFVGVFSLDTLPRGINRHMPFKLIVNLQPRDKPGSHWIAISRALGGEAYYFDTFGRKPPPTIASWLNNNSYKWRYSTTAIQDAKDKVSCGYLCINFLQRLEF